jgi:hypothetical protein|tara:strand:- start:6695 stop:7324 length:630 start_codon:yes stop_codon:yes gene_type:complete
MLFISYARNDKSLVQPLVKLLRASGSDVFIDLEDLDYGSNWKKQLTEAISRSTRFLLFWSKSSSQSDHVEEEWREALEMADVAIVPIMLDPTPLPSELGALHGTDELQSIVNKVRIFARITRCLTYLIPLILLVVLGFFATYTQFSQAPQPEVVLRGGKPTPDASQGISASEIAYVTIGGTLTLGVISYLGTYWSRRRFASQVNQGSNT